MTKEDRQKLRDAAVAAAKVAPPRTAVEGATCRWELQTSNSFRRIGARGDGDVLCGTTHPIDGHPDLLAAPGVLDYIVAAQPPVVVALLDDIDALEAKLLAAREICDKISAVEGRLDDMASVLTGLAAAIAKIAEAPDSAAAAEARALVEKLSAALPEVKR
jgi:hypothetical protein